MRTTFRTCFFVCLWHLVVTGPLSAQHDKVVHPDSLGMSVLFDRPDELRDLYIQVQPLIAELARTGNQAGYGLGLHYFSNRWLEADLQFRKSWSRKMDQAREDGYRNANTGNGLPANFYLEAGLLFHLRQKSSADTLIAALKPKAGLDHKVTGNVSTRIPAGVKSVYSLRLGAAYRRNSFDVSQALERQGELNAAILLPEQYVDELGLTRPFRAFTGMTTVIALAGINYSIIRNMAAGFDDYEVVSRDAVVSCYADFLFAPELTMDDLLFDGNLFPLNVVERQTVGMRAGVDIRHDRDIGFAFGAEAGIRPGPSKGGAYMLLKVSIPVFARYIGR